MKLFRITLNEQTGHETYYLVAETWFDMTEHLRRMTFGGIEAAKLVKTIECLSHDVRIVIAGRKQEVAS